MTTGNDDGAPSARPDEGAGWVAYDFAVLNVLQHPHLGIPVPVGVVMHARTAEFLRLAVLTDVTELARRLPDVDAELLARYLCACAAICAGDTNTGPIALAPPSERFHWITAPRSDVIQCGPAHEGLCQSLEGALEELYAEYVDG